MNNKNVAIVLGVALTASIVFLLFSYNKYQKFNQQKINLQANNSTVNKNESNTDSVASSIDVKFKADVLVGKKCSQRTIREENLVEESLYYYVNDDMWKEEMKTITNGNEITTHILNDGNWYYIWGDKLRGSGIKIEASRVKDVYSKWDKISTEEDTAEKQGTEAIRKNSIEQHNQSKDKTLVEQIVGDTIGRLDMQHIEKQGYACSPETLSGAKFLPPSDIDFQIPPDMLASEAIK